MFNRNAPNDSGNRNIANRDDTSRDSGIRNPAAETAAARDPQRELPNASPGANAGTKPAVPPRLPAGWSAPAAEASQAAKTGSAVPAADAADVADNKRLIVGRNISLNGTISACDRLIVEGQVEAQLNDCHTIEIAEAGTFKGAAEIESAEISGHYEGSLTVRSRLLIHSTGTVSGTVRYGELQIEKGGRIKGDVNGIDSGMKFSPVGQTVGQKLPAPSLSETAISSSGTH